MRAECLWTTMGSITTSNLLAMLTQNQGGLSQVIA
jgi:hypothetical protein